MATEEALHTISRPANADLSTKQYLFVKAVSGGAGLPGKVDVCSATTDVAMGVLQDKPAAADRAAEVGVLGVTKITAGAAFLAGVRLAPMASGKAQTAVSTQFPAGIALTSATADGDIVEMQLAPSLVPLP